MRHVYHWVGCVILGLLLGTNIVRAGVEEARKYIDEAAELIRKGDNDKAGTKLDLAEVELEGVAADVAGPLKSQIEALKKSMTSAADAEARTRLMRDVERQFRNTEESIGNVRDFDDNAKSFLELINDPENARLIGSDEVAKYVKQVDTFKKVHAKKAIDVYVERIESDVKRLEEEWTEKKKELTEGSPAAAQSAQRDMYNYIERSRKALEDLPADNDKRKAFEARISKVDAEFTQIMGASQVADVLERMTSGLASYEDEFKGWEAETPATFAEFRKMASSDMQYLNMPKTAAFLTRGNWLLENFTTSENYQAVKDDAKVKAFVENLKKQLADARTKGLAAVMAAVEAAEKEPLSDDLVRDVERLSGAGSRGTAHMLIGDEAPELAGIVDRCNAIVKRQTEAVAGAQAARDEAFKKLSEEAEKAWPAMAAKFDAADGFDPDNPPVGKHVRFKDINNRMGWDYGSDEFPFASRVNGKPFAARFDPVVAAAFAEVSKKVGGNKMDDNGWDVIAIVEKGTVRITERVRADVRDSGNSSVGTLERWDPIDVPHVKIVAVHAGPVAVAVGSGAVKEDGKVEAPTQGASTSGGAAPATVAASSTGGASTWLWLLLTLLVGLAAAAACLMKANYAPLAAVSQAGQVQARLGGENLAIIGLICAAIGLLFLLRGFVYYGLLTNLAIIAAGLYAALDWLQARGIVKPELAATIRPLGVPIGLACAGLVIIRLLLGFIGVNLVVV